MPARKRRSRRQSEQSYLVVRGKGNDVYIAVAPAPVSDAVLARLIDTYDERRPGVMVASRAMIVNADSAPVALVGQSLGPPKK